MPSRFAPGSRRALEESRKRKPGGTTGQSRKVGVVCGAQKRGGGKCQLAAGWGTPHPGIGACKMHGGSVPNHVKAAAKAEYRLLLGNPIECSPEEALMRCIHIRSGEIQWLTARMGELDKKDWVEDTLVGKQFHIYARERQAAMRDVARFAQMAISMNIEERRVRLAEMYGEMLANLLSAILQELHPHLDKEGRAIAPTIIRRHLMLLDQQQALPGGEAEDAEYTEVAA